MKFGVSLDVGTVFVYAAYDFPPVERWPRERNKKAIQRQQGGLIVTVD